MVSGCELVLNGWFQQNYVSVRMEENLKQFGRGSVGV